MPWWGPGSAVGRVSSRVASGTAMWRIVPRIAFSPVRPGGRRGPARIRKSSRPPGSPLETLRRGAPPRISPETSSTAVLKAALETKALASSQLPSAATATATVPVVAVLVLAASLVCVGNISRRGFMHLEIFSSILALVIGMAVAWPVVIVLTSSSSSFPSV